MERVHRPVSRWLAYNLLHALSRFVSFSFCRALSYFVSLYRPCGKPCGGNLPALFPLIVFTSLCCIDFPSFSSFTSCPIYRPRMNLYCDYRCLFSSSHHLLKGNQSMAFSPLSIESVIAFPVFFLSSSVIAHQVYFVASETEDELGSPDMINTQYLQRVMSVQRAIERANFTSAVDGQVSAGVPRDGVLVPCQRVFPFFRVKKKKDRRSATAMQNWSELSILLHFFSTRFRVCRGLTKRDPRCISLPALCCLGWRLGSTGAKGRGAGLKYHRVVDFRALNSTQPA